MRAAHNQCPCRADCKVAFTAHEHHSCQVHAAGSNTLKEAFVKHAKRGIQETCSTKKEMGIAPVAAAADLTQHLLAELSTGAAKSQRY